MSNQLPKKIDPQNDYDSGVTNGDVDWLFRGKSKKLTKKMNLSKETEKNTETPEKGDKTEKGDKGDQSPKTGKVQTEKVPTDKVQTAKETPEPPKEDKDTKDTKDTNNKDTKKESSKLDKLFRTRSSSASKADQKDPKEAKKNFNLINYAGTSFDGTSFYNQDFEHSYLDTSAKPVGSGANPSVKPPGLNSGLIPRASGTSKSSATAATSATNTTGNVNTASGSNSLSASVSNTSNTSNNSNSSNKSNNSPSLSATSSPVDSTVKSRSRSSSTGSNSGKDGKKSLFSSLSSKFKSQPNPPPTSGGADGTKLSADMIAAGGAINSAKEKEDLSSLYNKPPAEIGGIPIKRRNSVQDLQPQNSLDRLSSSANSFNSLFKRRSSTSSTASQQSTQSVQQPQPHNTRIILNKNPNKEKIPIKDLHDVTLKRVNFAIDKLIYDPQQQIPSRRPKKGNVLIPEDLMAPPPRLSQGISLNDGNCKPNEPGKYSEKELSLALEAQRRALIEADKHAQEAHNSAKRIASEVQLYRSRFRRKSTITEGNEDVDDMDMEFENETERAEEKAEHEREQHQSELKNIEIDKPLHYHEKYFDDDTMELDISNLTLEQIYTRCCHLREILPIPATLKQLKNKTKPLSVLKLLNPKPTLIDILSFSDFIAIVPINTVIFDNVTMTTEMLKHILASLTYNKSLEKLSLRNVPIDELGWKFLCKFLFRNHSIRKLDISQQRIKSDTKVAFIRSSMNWRLFIKCLIVRGGIDELVINGCKLPDDIFKDLVEKALPLSTFRLGIASCELNAFKVETVCNWMKHPDSNCVGVDVAFNDLSQGLLKYFIDCFNSGNVKLIFFSLYQTNLSDATEAAQLLESLTKVKTLRFLDLSSLPDLFPGIISKLNIYLPKFENLKRIHFDLNNLTSPSVIAISEILPKVKGLLHVSFLGNRNLNSSVAASIYAAIKKSTSIYTLDLDYDLINDKVNQKIAFYLMRNMDNVINFNSKNNESHDPNTENPEEEELMFDGSLLMETAEKLMIESESTPNKKEDIKLQKIISNALIERTRELRDGIHRTIDTLFDKRNAGTLSLEGKERLLRFCLLDASLEKLVHLFEEQANKTQATGMSPSPSGDFQDASDSIENANETLGTSNSTGLREQTLISNSSKSAPPSNDTPTININDKELLHQSSTELITSGGPIISPRNTETLNKLGYFQGSTESSTFQPHQVVVDSKPDGQNIPIDNLTGRPVLMRSISQTSSHAKEQELEEGEFHRWGFFMQQRNNSNSDLKNAEKDKETTKRESEDEPPKQLPALNVLPSGGELRDAIIEAKGIESITDLIDKINNNRVSLERIYQITDEKQQKEILQNFEKLKVAEDLKKKCNDCKPKEEDEEKESAPNVPEEVDQVSIDSGELDNDKDCQHVDAVVDQVYDKLLNDAQRVRSTGPTNRS